MPIPQLNAVEPLERLEEIIEVAEDVCDNRRQMVALFVNAIGAVSAATPDGGAEMLDVALSELMKMRLRLPESQQRMRAARELHTTGPH